MTIKNANQHIDRNRVTLTRISWEPEVTEKLEAWIRQTAEGHYQDFTSEIETYFERKLNRPCIAVSNGSSALHLALRLLNRQSGAEVIIPSLTYAACANTVIQEGLTPVFSDIHPENWCLDPNALSETIKARLNVGARIGAVMLVHLYGQACAVDDIKSVCQCHGIPIIEDAAEALGGQYELKQLGSQGRYACFSFNANKILTGMGGGLLALQSKEEKQRIRNLIRHGRLPFENGLAHYIHHEAGYNYQMSGYSAALIHFQLQHLAERLFKKQKTFEIYCGSLLTKVPFKPQSGITSQNHTRWLSCFQLLDKSNRDKLCSYLSLNGIEARPVFKPLNQQPAYRGYTFAGCEYAENIGQTAICLPSPCDLTEEEQHRVITTIQKWYTKR